MESYQSNQRRTIEFIFVSLGAAAVLYAVLYVADFLPEAPVLESVAVSTGSEAPASSEARFLEAVQTEVILPTRVRIDALDREVVVLNPDDASTAVLDAALLQGIVRHPDSADLSTPGTMFLLGHSSHLPTVKNKNFQAFNDIEKLKVGDTIRVYTPTHEYVYTVNRVYEAKASRAEVPLQFETPKLVLATCNSFGTKDDRFIVEAGFTEMNVRSDS